MCSASSSGASSRRSAFRSTSWTSSAGRPLPAFRFRDYGALVSIGRSTAVGSLVGQITGRRFNLHGALARWSYRVQQRRHLALLHGPVRTLLATLGGWLTGRSQPAVKLH